MKAHRASGSKTELLLLCQYWARADVAIPEDITGQRGKDGTTTHALGEAFCNGIQVNVAAACAAKGGEMERVTKLWQSAEPVYKQLKSAAAKGEGYSAVWAEVPLVWNVASGLVREVRGTEHRDYGEVGPFDLPMTLDVLFRITDGAEQVATVLDLKTGDADELPDEFRSGQLRSNGFAAARYYGVQRARVGYVVATDDGAPATVEMAELDSLDLEIHAAKVLGALEAIPNAQPSPGDQCDWCPARAVCPATLASMAKVAELPLADVESIAATSITTLDQAGKAFVRLKVIKDAVKAVENRIKEVVGKGAAPTREGKAVRLAPKSRESFSKDRLAKGVAPEKAEEMLRELRAVGAVQRTEWMELREGKVS